MKEEIIKPKAGLQLRRVGRQYMIVEACTETANLSRVYSLNETAACMWQRLSGGDATRPDLVDGLVGGFEVDAATAARDVERQLAEWRSFGLID